MYIVHWGRGVRGLVENSLFLFCLIPSRSHGNAQEKLLFSFMIAAAMKIPNLYDMDTNTIEHLNLAYFVQRDYRGCRQ